MELRGWHHFQSATRKQQRAADLINIYSVPLYQLMLMPLARDAAGPVPNESGEQGSLWESGLALGSG